MKAEPQPSKPTTELLDCANALRDAGIGTSEEALGWLIGEGYLHLSELEAATSCNQIRINALMLRIDHAEEVLARKRRLAEEKKR